MTTNDIQVTETFDDTPTSNKRRRRADDTGDADSQSHTTVNLDYLQ